MILKSRFFKLFGHYFFCEIVCGLLGSLGIYASAKAASVFSYDEITCALGFTGDLSSGSSGSLAVVLNNQGKIAEGSGPEGKGIAGEQGFVFSYVLIMYALIESLIFHEFISVLVFTFVGFCLGPAIGIIFSRFDKFSYSHLMVFIGAMLPLYALENKLI